jgi:hypothetical protein
MRNDFSLQWMKEEITKQRNLKDKLHLEFNSIKDSSTSYAQGIWKMYCLRCEIIATINRHIAKSQCEC